MFNEYSFFSSFRGYTVEYALRKILGCKRYSSIEYLVFECFYNGRCFFETIDSAEKLIDHPILSTEFTLAHTSEGALGEYLVVTCDAPHESHTRWESHRFKTYMDKMWEEGEPMY